MSGKFITSSPSLQFNVVYYDKVIIVSLEHGSGDGGMEGGGGPYYSDVIRYGSQNNLSTHFRAVILVVNAHISPRL